MPMQGVEDRVQHGFDHLVAAFHGVVVALSAVSRLVAFSCVLPGKYLRWSCLLQGVCDLITRGLDGLPERLKGYKAQRARFAKWREV